MDKAICPTVTKQRQRRPYLLTAIDLHKWLKAPRKQQVRADGSHQKLFVPQVFERAIPSPEQDHHGPGGVVKRNGCTTKVRRSGAEDWLGHTAAIRLVGKDVVLVLTNAGTCHGSGWSARSAAVLRKRLRRGAACWSTLLSTSSRFNRPFHAALLP